MSELSIFGRFLSFQFQNDTFVDCFSAAVSVYLITIDSVSRAITQLKCTLERKQSAHTYVNRVECMDKSNSNTNWLTNNNNCQSQWKYKQTNENTTRFQFTFYLSFTIVCDCYFTWSVNSVICVTVKMPNIVQCVLVWFEEKIIYFCRKKSRKKIWRVHQDVPAEIVPSTKNILCKQQLTNEQMKERRGNNEIHVR